MLVQFAALLSYHYRLLCTHGYIVSSGQNDDDDENSLLRHENRDIGPKWKCI